MAQLMTIWASGYLETTCRALVLEYTRQRAEPNIVNYVSASVERFQNPKMEKISALIRMFDGEAADRIDEFAEGRIKESVNSIVGVRHQIAHGKSATISVAMITQHFENARRLVQKMRELVLPTSSG